MNETTTGVDRSRQASSKRRRPLSIGLTIVFVVALAMGPGPGMLLINRPESILGLPALYAWGLFWYVVEVSVVVLAYFLVWERDGGPPQSS